jgi:hypothetical protein
METAPFLEKNTAGAFGASKRSQGSLAKSWTLQRHGKMGKTIYKISHIGKAGIAHGKFLLPTAFFAKALNSLFA